MMMTIMLAGPTSSSSAVKRDDKVESGRKPPISTSAQQAQPVERRKGRRRQRSYNPYSNHVIEGNDRPKERPILAQSRLSPSDSFSSRKDDDDDDDEDDNDLEQMARQIRDELQYTEILELAMEAERAAEAGHDFFAGQPSTFSGNGHGHDAQRNGAAGIPRHYDDAVLMKSISSKRPQLGMRSKSTSAQGLDRMRKSQSTSGLAAKSRRKKLNVLKLRPAGDVFPSFDSFHDHLRSHLSRNHVDPRSLIYNPQPQKSPLTRPGPIANLTLLGSPDKKMQSVLHDKLDALSSSFSFDRWVHTSSMSSQEEEVEYANALVDHVAEPPKRNGKSNPRPIEPLPGLDLPDGYFTRCRRVQHTDILPPLSPPRSPTSQRQHPSPKAILDQAQDDGDESDIKDEPRFGPDVSACTEKTVPMTPPPPYPKRKDAAHTMNAASLQLTARHDIIAHGNICDSPGSNSIRDDSLHENMTSIVAPGDSGPTFETPTRLRDIRQCEITQYSLVERTEGSGTPLLVQPPMLRKELVASDVDAMIRSENESIFVPHNFLLKPGAEFPTPTIAAQFRHRPSSPLENGTCSYSPADVEASMTAPVDTSAVTETTLNAYEPAQIPISPKSRRKIRTRKVKVLIYGSSPARRGSMDSESNSILQDSQMISTKTVIDPSQESLFAGECSCLSLSPTTSLVSSHDVAPQPEILRHDIRQAKPEPDTPRSPSSLPTRRRSSSAGTLLDLDSANNRTSWSPFSNKAFSKSKGYDAAVSMFSRFSPTRNSNKTLQISPASNEEFLHNYLYCSKATKVLVEEQQSCHEAPIACDANSWLCAPFFPDADLSNLFRSPPPKASGRTGLSLGREPRHTSGMESDSWLDLANEQFDGVMTQLVGQAAERKENPWNIAFEAPILKKSSLPKRSSWTGSAGDADNGWKEEKKSEDIRYGKVEFSDTAAADHPADRMTRIPSPSPNTSAVGTAAIHSRMAINRRHKKSVIDREGFSIEVNPTF